MAGKRRGGFAASGRYVYGDCNGTDRAGAEAPARLLWTVREFERAAKRGAFERPERLELVNGEIYQKRTQNGPHAAATTLCAQSAQALCSASGEAEHVRVQMPLTLGETSAPEPDVAIVAGGARDYAQNHPVAALLVIGGIRCDPRL